MRISVPLEGPSGEARVALVPESVKKLIKCVEKRNQAIKNPKENKACDRWSS